MMRPEEQVVDLKSAGFGESKLTETKSDMLYTDDRSKEKAAEENQDDLLDLML